MRIAVARVLQIIALSLLATTLTHAEQTPGTIFDVLGRLLKPKPEVSAVEPPTTETQSRNLSVTSAVSERRIALVIGNANYVQGALANPVNDARSMASRLRSLGFEVQLRENLKAREIGSVYRDFRSAITPGAVALVFYAGHGLQFKGQNYFPAIDSEITGEEDVPLQSLNLGTLLDNMDEAKAGVSLVFLDACRDNPFARRFRSASRGLAKVEAPSGTLIHYATKPGSVADDGIGKNGTYTEALLAQIGSAGLPVELMLKEVTKQVKAKTKGKQEPWVEGSLSGDFYFIFQGPTKVTISPPEIDAESEAWKAAESANTNTGYQAYLDAYPKGKFTVQAKIKLDSLKVPLAAATDRTDPPTTFGASTSSQVGSSSIDSETAFWNEVKATGAREYFDAYLKQYPKGKYLALAKIELKKLDDQDKARRSREEAEKQQAAERERQEAERAEQGDWDRAKASGTAAAYADYLVDYPKGRFAALARAAQQKLQREDAERQKLETSRREREDREREKQDANNLQQQQAQSQQKPEEIQSGHWVVQLGAYRDTGNVSDLMSKLKEMRIPAYTEIIDSSPKITALRAGPFKTQQAAEAAQTRIKILNISGPVVKVSPEEKTRTPAVVDAGSCAKPEYPPQSIRAKEEGLTVLQFLIGSDGTAIESKVEKSSGYRRLDEAARRGLSLCKFKSGTEDGKPVQSWARIEYQWRVDQTGNTIKDCANCPPLVVIPAGEFVMGSDPSFRVPVRNETPARTVKVKSFAIGQMHITRSQYAEFVSESGYDVGNRCMTRETGKWEDKRDRGWTNSGFTQGNTHPATCIGLVDAQAYVGWLSKKTGKKYRLPSEAEWEYAERAGARTEWFYGDNADGACEYGNVADLSSKAGLPNAENWKYHECIDGYSYTSPVGIFKPNRFGLYDMLGNARQWTEDCWNDNYNGAPIDGTPWTSGQCDTRVLRGSAWSTEAPESQSSRRSRIKTSLRGVSDIGLRIARDYP